VKYCFIFNPASGTIRDPGAFSTLLEGFGRRKGLDFEIRRTAGPGDGTGLAREAAGRGFDRIVAIGGDGTIHDIAAGVLGTGAALCLVPRGSGNGFAREFGIPLEPLPALEELLRSRPLAIDVGRANGEPFFNVAGFGFDARVAEAFDRSQRGGRRGMLPYFLLAWREYWSYVPVPVHAVLDGKDRAFGPFLGAIANGRQYGSGAVIAPKATVDDGLLHLAVVRPAPLPRFIWHLPRLFRGTVDRCPLVETVPFAEGTFTFEREAPYHVDGEVRKAARELRVTLEPKALEVCVPPRYRA